MFLKQMVKQSTGSLNLYFDSVAKLVFQKCCQEEPGPDKNT